MDALRLCHEFPLNQDCFRAMLELPDSARCLEHPLWLLAYQTKPSLLEHKRDPTADAAAAAVTSHAHADADAGTAEEGATAVATAAQGSDSGALTFSQLMAFAWRVCKADVDQRCEMFWTLLSTSKAHAKHAVTLSTDEVRIQHSTLSPRSARRICCVDVAVASSASHTCMHSMAPVAYIHTLDFGARHSLWRLFSDEGVQVWKVAKSTFDMQQSLAACLKYGTHQRPLGAYHCLDEATCTPSPRARRTPSGFWRTWSGSLASRLILSMGMYMLVCIELFFDRLERR
jgi:hypothetical protein